MAKLSINTGNEPNDRSGDSLRSAFTKINANFTELYDRAVNTDAQILTLTGNTLAITGGNSVELNISPVGDLTIPGDIQSEEDISIRINLADSTQRVWRFGEDGNFEAPGTVSAPNINATNHFMLPVYATDAARDSAIPSPQPGMMVFVTGGEGAGLQVRGVTQWNPVGGLTGV